MVHLLGESVDRVGTEDARVVEPVALRVRRETFCESKIGRGVAEFVNESSLKTLRSGLAAGHAEQRFARSCCVFP